MSDVNPFTNINARGFRVVPDISADKRKCLNELQAVVPLGHTVTGFRYKPAGAPADSVVEILVRPPSGPVVAFEARAPLDANGRPWGPQVARVLALFLRAQY